jgi:N-acetylglucosaminyldiphosphoundecaprenol N-acetyl-beta-D-mannosaminyltransferase
MPPPHPSFYHVNLSAVNMGMTLSQMETWIEKQQSNYICLAPAHSLMECFNNLSLLPVFNNAGMVAPDGMAVVWLLQLKGYKDVRRVYGPDLLIAACEHGLKRGWGHYFLGGAPETLSALTAQLNARFHGLRIAGQYSPPFHTLSEQENQEIIIKVNTSGADILWVGLGSPRQEIWMHENLGKVNSPVMVGVGAAFDFLSGNKPQAPQWMQHIGMEWLFRLITEPKRLWPRYRQYPRFIWLALRELLEW